MHALYIQGTTFNLLDLGNRTSIKAEYLQLLTELDRLQIPSYYETVEISVLGHNQTSAIQNNKKFMDS